MAYSEEINEWKDVGEIIEQLWLLVSVLLFGILSGDVSWKNHNMDRKNSALGSESSVWGSDRLIALYLLSDYETMNKYAREEWSGDSTEPAWKISSSCPSGRTSKKVNQKSAGVTCVSLSISRWMEACLNEELPPTTELEEGLRNGVYLAKLGNFFSPKVVSLKKIYDREQTRYKVSALRGI